MTLLDAAPSELALQMSGCTPLVVAHDELHEVFHFSGGLQMSGCTPLVVAASFCRL
jgi:hypothetical protein